jgi:hypothetical protein
MIRRQLPKASAIRVCIELLGVGLHSAFSVLHSSLPWLDACSVGARPANARLSFPSRRNAAHSHTLKTPEGFRKLAQGWTAPGLGGRGPTLGNTHPSLNLPLPFRRGEGPGRGVHFAPTAPLSPSAIANRPAPTKAGVKKRGAGESSR